MTIYISDKSKKEECEKLRIFMEQQWLPEIRHNLYDFCSKVDGQIVNKELAERILEERVWSFSYPLGSALYREGLVTVKGAGIFWHNRTIDGIMIDNVEQLLQFFEIKENQEKYILEDEKGNICALYELATIMRRNQETN